MSEGTLPPVSFPTGSKGPSLALSLSRIDEVTLWALEEALMLDVLGRLASVL